MSENKKMKISREILRPKLSLLVALFFGIALGYSVPSVWQQYTVKEIQTNDEATMSGLSALIVLPEELPSIATVTDQEKLADQAFFQHAHNGDKVIIYQMAKRAYLYRPSENKIIDMTVIAVNDAGQDESSIPTFQTNER